MTGASRTSWTTLSAWSSSGAPEWTDHNVSDPGVTLIEAFAQMVDQLIYRLNRVPDRHYIKFLDLLGVQLFPPTAATGTVTFWLAAPQPAAVVVRAETEDRKSTRLNSSHRCIS